ncbi:hypothetical protein [Klebsiella variicola]|uniref:hypothetical protein n=1 Tax=Klebsiella variicola TaxID=244366 RepID=UPI00115F00C1|nr:hypothetical protein [Klebsiella variicola]
MSDDDRWTHFPWLIKQSDSSLLVRELIGRKCRVVREPDAATQEIASGRVTVYLSDDGHIIDIYINSADDGSTICSLCYFEVSAL